MLKIYHKYLLSKGYNLIISADAEVFEKEGKVYQLKTQELAFDEVLVLEDKEGNKEVLPPELLLELEDSVLEMTAADRFGYNICGQKNLAKLTVYSKGNIEYAVDLITNKVTITVGKSEKIIRFLTLKKTVSFVLERQRNGDWVEIGTAKLGAA